MCGRRHREVRLLSHSRVLDDALFIYKSGYDAVSVVASLTPP